MSKRSQHLLFQMELTVRKRLCPGQISRVVVHSCWNFHSYVQCFKLFTVVRHNSHDFKLFRDGSFYININNFPESYARCLFTVFRNDSLVVDPLNDVCFIIENLLWENKIRFLLISLKLKLFKLLSKQFKYRILCSSTWKA